MVLLVQKLARPLKFHSRLENNHHSRSSGAAPSASLRDFLSRISAFISQTWLKPPKCFELIQITNRAFAELVVEIDHPMSGWGEKLSDEYLSYTLNLLDLLNSVNSSVSHLTQAKISIFHALSLIKNSSPSAANHLKKIPRGNLGKDFSKPEGSIRIGERPVSGEKESVVLQALIVSKKIGFLALGFVLSGLCSDDKIYMEIRKSVEGFDESLIKDLDLRFCKEVREIQGIVEEVNRAIGLFCGYIYWKVLY